MGVEFRVIRKDSKTIFDLGKRLGYDIPDLFFSQEELLEYLIVWQIQLWEDGADPISALIIRDRILDFVEGASSSDLQVVTDTTWDGEASNCIDYTFTHDRYISKQEIEQYRQLLRKTDDKEYRKNPVEFFRNSGISKGNQIDSNNCRKAMWKVI